MDETPTSSTPTETASERGRTVFARFRLERFVGRGGMGVVWQAYDVQLERQVALKFIPEVAGSDITDFESLKKEARRCLMLTHPHIVRVHDLVCDLSDREAAIVMEYVEGRTLRQLQAEQPGGVFSASRLRPWVGQLCEALNYAHEKVKIIHRDLKPANVMVDNQGEIRLMDFGIAAQLAATRSSTGIAGTPAYMSPQQFQGVAAAVSDDVYSLGATLYELLAGVCPFTGTLAALAHQVLSVEPIAPSVRRDKTNEQFAERIPATWDATILRCLSKEPEQRPRSVREVWAALCDEANDSSVPAARPTRRTGMRIAFTLAFAAGVVALLSRHGSAPAEKPAAHSDAVTQTKTADAEAMQSNYAVKIRAEMSRAEYRVGEGVELKIFADRDCYVCVIQLGVDGSATQLLPNRFQAGNHLRAGETLHLPDAGAIGGKYVLRTTTPTGEEEIIVLYAKSPFDRLKNPGSEANGSFPEWQREELFKPDGSIALTASDAAGSAEVSVLQLRYQLHD